VATLLERPRQTNLEEVIRREASLPGCEYCASLKQVFSKIFWNNWTENVSGDVANQALSACLSKGNFEGCTGEQAMRFCAAILLGGHSFELDWICHRHSGGISSRLWCGWA
jgi:hypothetical protein